MWNHRTYSPILTALLCASTVCGLTGCTRETPTEPPDHGDPDLAGTASSLTFGPFPGGTTIFVDVANTTGVEDGTRAHPFRTLRKGLGAAKSDDVVGVAPGLYAGDFPADWDRQNYTIDGLRNFKLIGSGVKRTTIQGNHSGSLIYLVNGASALIQGLTIEAGGMSRSVGGGVQVVAGDGHTSSLTLRNVILRGNIAANGGALAAEGVVSLRLVNVLIANNAGSNSPGAVYLGGHRGRVTATFINTTITDNSAAGGTGGVLLEHDARLRLVNSIVWNNAQAEIDLFTGTEERLTVFFSDVGERLYAGEGNRSVHPVFANPSLGNYRLHHSSPLIDAGTLISAPTNDIVGKHRPVDGDGDCIAKPDMGAYEFGVPATSCSNP